ncbi:hypothetical protein MMC28_001717 [Mycoblastus sanguinarius]|nr:hypothetical protein [Mycoblastus sanguinarius]
MVDEGNWGHSIVALTTFFIILVFIALVLRIVTRVWIVKSFWWDDFTIILAVLGTTIGAGLDFVEVHYGFGKHEKYLSSHHLQEFRKYTYGEWIQTFATIMWTKVSICLFLMRLPDRKAWLRPLQWAVAFLLFSNTILTVMWIMQCQPIHAAWDSKGICLTRSAKEGIILTQGIISVVSDFSFASFPILILWQVQIDFKTKLGLWLLMCLGYITGACCLVRIVLNGQALPLDETYDGIVNWVWRLFEVQIGIIAACIPTLRPFYMWLARYMKGEGAGLDANIKFLNKSPESWAEKVEEPREPRGETARDVPADTMRDELVREGILTTERTDMDTTHGHTVERSDDSDFRDEMNQYGINDALR